MMDDTNKNGDEDFDDFEDFDDDIFDDDLDDMIDDNLGAMEMEDDAPPVPDPITSFDDLEDDFEDDEDFVFEAGADSSQKTFVQKYFTVIVVLIVAVFAGVFFLATQGGGENEVQDGAIQQATNNAPSAPPETPISPEIDSANASNAIPPLATLETIEALDGDKLPPQPIPIESTLLIEEAPLVETPIPTETLTEASQDNALTPLPGADNTAKKPTELTDLKEVLQQPADIRNSAPVDPIEEETLAPSPLLSPTPTSLTETAQAEESDVLPLLTDSDLDQANEGPIALIQADLNGSASKTITQEDIEDSLDSLDVSSEISEEIDDLNARRETLSAENSSLTKDINKNRDELDALSDELRDLQRQVKEARQALVDTKKAVEKQAAIEKSLPEPKAKVTTRTAPKPAAAQKTTQSITPKPAPQKVKTSWTLRSASPGRATLADKRSNDFVSIEVGTNVRGLGRIQSIKIENGKWIVRGTQGTISR